MFWFLYWISMITLMCFLPPLNMHVVFLLLFRRKSIEIMSSKTIYYIGGMEHSFNIHDKDQYRIRFTLYDDSLIDVFPASNAVRRLDPFVNEFVGIDREEVRTYYLTARWWCRIVEWCVRDQIVIYKLSEGI